MLGSVATAADPDQDDVLREYRIKAAFLYNFAKFTEWPEGAFGDEFDPLRVCVLGQGAFLQGLVAIAGKSVRGRRIATSSLGHVDDTADCHVVFVGASQAESLEDVLDHLSQRPVLTVSDIDGFAAAGGMIALNKVENRIRFTVNLYATRSGHLTLSPQVLRLADIVNPVSTADHNPDGGGTSTVE